MTRIATLALTVFLLTPVPALAQTIRSPFEFVDERQLLGVTAGYLRTDRGNVGFGPHSAPFYGLRYAIRLSGPFVAEATAALIHTTRTVVDTLQVDGVRQTRGDGDLTLLHLGAAARFDLTGPRTWHGLMPYLLAGAGAVIQTRNVAAGDEHLPADVRFRFGTSFAGSLGAGVEWLPVRRVGVQADVRNIFWRLNTPEPFLRDTRIPTDEYVQNFALTGALVIRF
jgi:hypothetical protein